MNTAAVRPLLQPEQRRSILRLVRESLAHLLGLRSEAPSLADLDPALFEARGAFVTLHRGSELRGCIGHVLARSPLAEAVIELARSAAQDRRFEPVQAEEFDKLLIEVSVMSPLERLAEPAPSQVRIGIDGLLLRFGESSGLLLPQVAASRSWDGARFLSETCRKARLPVDCWKHPEARLFRFSCEVFGEAEEL